MENYLNGQRTPNIFERARAYDDGNEGIIQPKKDGYEETYKTLSNDEKSFVFRHPILAYKFNNNANKARSAVEYFPNKKDGYGDAIRHLLLVRFKPSLSRVQFITCRGIRECPREQTRQQHK